MGTGEAGSSRGEVGAKKEEIAGLHALCDALQKGRRSEVWKYAEEGEQLDGGRREVEGGQGFQKVDFEGSFVTGREMAGGAAGQGEVGVRGEEESGGRDFFEEHGLLDSIGTTEGD